MGVGVVVSLQLSYFADADLELGCTGSADRYDLLAEVLAVIVEPVELNAATAWRTDQCG